MIPVKHSNIFRNRWWALLWAAGILWFAYDVAGGSSGEAPANNSANSAETTDVTGAPVDQNQVDQVAGAIANF